MKYYLADTHALYWYLSASPQLGDNDKAAFEEGVKGDAQILIPSIVLAELYYLNVKVKSLIPFTEWTRHLGENDQFMFVALIAPNVLDFDRDGAVTEMHDRIIVGAARRAGAILLTKDHNIVDSGLVPTLW